MTKVNPNNVNEQNHTFSMKHIQIWYSKVAKY